MSNLSLYDITEEKEAITALLEMDQGEVTEDHEALITQVEQMIALKIDRVVGFYNYLTDEIDNAKKRRDEITGFIKVSITIPQVLGEIRIRFAGCFRIKGERVLTQR